MASPVAAARTETLERAHNTLRVNAGVVARRQIGIWRPMTGCCPASVRVCGFESVFLRADRAPYAAKHGGRGRMTIRLTDGASL
jgi:hypothetical protein